MTANDRKINLGAWLQEANVSLDLFPYEWLCTTDFFDAPASKGHHAAYPGGLYDHSVNVTKELLRLTQNGTTEQWQRPESPYIVGLLHDVTKIGLYKQTGKSRTGTLIYQTNPLYDSYGGHGFDSVCKILNHMSLTDEERMCIRFHMGAYDREDWDGFDAAIKKYPNVLWTHTADMVASKLMEKD